MKININRDITTYKKEQWKGLSREDLLKLSFAGAVSVGGIFFLSKFFFLPAFLSACLVLPFVFVICLFCFWHVDQMSFAEYLWISFNFARQRELLFESIHDPQELEETKTEDTNTDQGEKEEKAKKKTKTEKREEQRKKKEEKVAEKQRKKEEKKQRKKTNKEAGKEN